MEGREALYAYCEARGVPYKRIGKLMVAADESQLDDLRSYKEKGHKNGVCAPVACIRQRWQIGRDQGTRPESGMPLQQFEK